MSSIVGTVFPLWRIHNFSCHGAGGTVKIVNIARPDTLALLTKLRGDYGPIWANGKLAFAVNYSSEPATLAEATLVRIKDVSASERPGVYNAELLVLCQARVCNISMHGAYPTATHAPDLAPLWRIHHMGLVGAPGFDVKRTEIKIQNIAREDTLAILTKLGGGDVKVAKGHMVAVCDYTANMVAGLRVLLVRIGDVTPCEEGGPPYNCTLSSLGHVQCASVQAIGAFPQVLLDEIPVWCIHNLNKGSSGPQHRIVNISRPDSVALLTFLGQGNPLTATGGLVIGCDYTAPPTEGESGRLVRIVKISLIPSEQVKYEAVLVDISSVTVGKYFSNEGKPERWWPRMTIVLPKVWSMPSKPPPEAPVRAPSRAVWCPYWMRCQKALLHLLCDTGLQNKFQENYIDSEANKCFCRECHSIQGESFVYQLGEQKYALPIGFARVGVKPGKTHGIIERGMKEWHVCFHGTKHVNMGDIILQGQLLAPGSTLHNRNTIKVLEGHINSIVIRVNEHMGNTELLNPTNKVFFSPSAKYSSHVFTQIHFSAMIKIIILLFSYAFNQIPIMLVKRQSEQVIMRSTHNFQTSPLNGIPRNYTPISLLGFSFRIYEPEIYDGTQL